MTIRTPLTLDSIGDTSTFKEKKVLLNAHKHIIGDWTYGDNTGSSGTTYTLTRSIQYNASNSGNMNSMNDERYTTGTSHVDAVSFPNEATTGEPVLNTTTYDRLDQYDASVTEPDAHMRSKSGRKLSYPVYWDNSTNSIKAMSRTDFRETFILPAIQRYMNANYEGVYDPAPCTFILTASPYSYATTYNFALNDGGTYGYWIIHQDTKSATFYNYNIGTAGTVQSGSSTLTQSTIISRKTGYMSGDTNWGSGYPEATDKFMGLDEDGNLHAYDTSLHNVYTSPNSFWRQCANELKWCIHNVAGYRIHWNIYTSETIGGTGGPPAGALEAYTLG